jgi:hypothetical protein
MPRRCSDLKRFAPLGTTRDRAPLTTAQPDNLAWCRPHVIRQWAARLILTPAARDDRGRPLYRPGDVLEAERATRGRNTRVPVQQTG